MINFQPRVNSWIRLRDGSYASVSALDVPRISYVRPGSDTIETDYLYGVAAVVIPGWEVIHLPTVKGALTFGQGTVIGTRTIAGVPVGLVHFHDSGQARWIPSCHLMRIMSPETYFVHGRNDHPERHVKGSALERLRLRLLAEAVTAWNDATGSLDRLNIDPLPHQIDLAHRILQSGTTNWLIADDVGLGKTVEAGLVLHGLKKQRPNLRCLILCPPGLVGQWKKEMRDKFNLKFRIYKEDIPAIESPDDWAGISLVIASIDTAAHVSHRGKFIESGHWDIVVFDESHKLSKHSRSQETQRYSLAEKLRPNADGYLLLSATPHQGKEVQFKNLLKLVRPALAERIETLRGGDWSLLSEFVIRNDKDKVTDKDGNLLFRGVETKRVEVAHDGLAAEFFDTFDDYVELLAEHFGHRGLFTSIYRKIASSSIYAAMKALEKRLARVRAGTVMSSIAETATDESVDGADLDLEQQLPSAETPDFLPDESDLLENLIERAAIAHACDPKRRSFIELARQAQDTSGSMLVFTESRETQEMLRGTLLEAGIRVSVINGSMNHRGKTEVVEEFNSSGGILVSTEAGAEGLNMQARCHFLVNYDLPWNPSRIVQRIGRLYRYGQNEIVRVINLVSEAGFDGRLLSVVYGKVRTIAENMHSVEGLNAERMTSRIVGDLLDLVDVEDILTNASPRTESRDEAAIEAAVQEARHSLERGREIFENAVSYDPRARQGAVPLDDRHVMSFVTGVLPLLDQGCQPVSDDLKIARVRLNGRYAALIPGAPRNEWFSVTCDRDEFEKNKAQGIHLLDFHDGLVRSLMQSALTDDFRGKHAVGVPLPVGTGAIFCSRVQWQDSKGTLTSRETVFYATDHEGEFARNPAWVSDMLLHPWKAFEEDVGEDRGRVRMIDEHRSVLDGWLKERMAEGFQLPNDIMTVGIGCGIVPNHGQGGT